MRTFRRLCALGAVALASVSVACHLDMLLKSKGNPQAVLTVSPSEVRDSARAGSHDVRSADVAITNGGGGALTWTATDHSGWIHLEPHEGEVPGTLTISLDPEDLAPGVYQGDVTVLARDAADSQFSTISVTFLVQRPGLLVAPMSLDHATIAGSGATWTDNLQVSNTGTGALTWTATEDRDWISLGTSSGTNNGTIPVTINSAGLSGGTYRDEIVISAPGATGSPARVAVTLTVFAPGLAINPGSIQETAPSGSTTPKTRNLHLTNSGTGALNWSASKSQAWLSLSKTSGGLPEDVLVTLDPTAQPPGMLRDTIVFTAPELPTPVKVPVDFEITQAGLSVSPPSITASADNNKKQDYDLTITNSGGGTLAWFAGADQPWISLGSLGGLAPSTLRVTLDPQGLSPGVHFGSVTVSSPGAVGSPFTVPVQLTITQQACGVISIDPDVVRTSPVDENDCIAPHRPGSYANVYGFNASPGDTISMRLTASFDAYLIFTDGAGNVLAQNDECPGESGTACIRNFPITAGGRYLIEGTSAAPGATGTVTMTVVRERAPGAPQDLRQFRADGSTAIPVGGTTSETEVVIKGRVDDPNGTDFVRLEVELQPLSNSFTGASNLLSDYVSASGGGTTVAVHARGLTNTGYHWQARACDRTGRCSAWLPFGNNAETDADFTAAVPAPGGSSRQQ